MLLKGVYCTLVLVPVMSEYLHTSTFSDLTQRVSCPWTSSCQRLTQVIMTDAPQGRLLYFGIGACDVRVSPHIHVLRSDSASQLSMDVFLSTPHTGHNDRCSSRASIVLWYWCL